MDRVDQPRSPKSKVRFLSSLRILAFSTGVIAPYHDDFRTSAKYYKIQSLTKTSLSLPQLNLMIEVQVRILLLESCHKAMGLQKRAHFYLFIMCSHNLFQG